MAGVLGAEGYFQEFAGGAVGEAFYYEDLVGEGVGGYFAFVVVAQLLRSRRVAFAEDG